MILLKSKKREEREEERRNKSGRERLGPRRMFGIPRVFFEYICEGEREKGTRSFKSLKSLKLFLPFE